MANETLKTSALPRAQAVVEKPAGSPLDSFLSIQKQEELKARITKKAPNAARAALRELLDVFFEQLKQRPGLLDADALQTIDGMIADLDNRLSRQVNAILHHEKFQKLEAAWRGLEHLVKRTDTSEGKIQIKVMPIRKAELVDECRKVNNAKVPEKTTLFERVYTAEYNQAGGEPFGLLVGDFHLDHKAPDIQILKGMARLAAASHAPFIAGVSPQLFGLDSWQQVTGDLDFGGRMRGSAYDDFRGLRESEDAKYLGLALPRFLARQPYDPVSNPVEGFSFKEEISNPNDPREEKVELEHKRHCWVNAAYAMAANITRAFHKYRWCAAIRGYESGGIVDNLPLYTFKSGSGEEVAKCATEIYISDDKDSAISNQGFLPLIMWKRTTTAAFLSGQSLQKAKTFPNSADETSNAKLNTRLPYIFATSRFAHYLKVMMRQRIGRSMSADQIKTELHNWIVSYVSAEKASEPVKRTQPLAAAVVEVNPDPVNPGYYLIDVFLKPHFQLEGVKIQLQLVARIPNKR